MTMGAGGALSEELAVDSRRGFFVNHDLAGYEVPVHADIPHQEVIFMDETDPMSSPMKAKGIGEPGLCGVSAAIANAICNATGVRVRHDPATLDKLIGGSPGRRLTPWIAVVVVVAVPPRRNSFDRDHQFRLFGPMPFQGPRRC